jgi:protein disulfide-isomerase
MERKMRVDIWSDVRCPFCYIGKRKFELALNRFSHKDQVEVHWHSFELDPDMKTRTDINVYDYFAEIKGVSRRQSEEMHQRVTAMAAEAGLDFHFDRAVMANSFNAHRLIQLAKTKNLGNEAEEQLFRAFFTEGRNIDDRETLLAAGIAIGLEADRVKELLSSRAFAEAVEQDEQQAREYGINGVPFFIFDGRYAVSGAQPPEVFLRALEKSFESFEEENKNLVVATGQTCTTGGNCQ